MQDEELEEELMRLRDLQVPDLPNNMPSRVWRSIQRQEAKVSPTFFAWPLWLVQPVMAVVFLLATTAFGFVYGSNYGEAARNDSSMGELAWSDAFDANSLYLPLPASYRIE